MKKAFQKIFNFLGYQISRVDKKKVKNFDTIHKKIFKNRKVKVIDIGANTGQSIIRFNKILNLEKIYSIEPSPIAFEQLYTNFKEKKNIKLFNFAIGRTKGISTFYDYNKNVLSSFNKLNNENKSNFKYKKNKVKVLTLDDFCKSNKISKINILKIDTQGNEINILKGAAKSLKKGLFELVELEIILGNYYEKYSNFYSYEKYLSYRYRLIATDKRLNFFNDKRMYCNILYIRNDLYEKI